jgi:hypothetical protein
MLKLDFVVKATIDNGQGSFLIAKNTKNKDNGTVCISIFATNGSQIIDFEVNSLDLLNAVNFCVNGSF